jgi:hypothetical protein
VTNAAERLALRRAAAASRPTVDLTCRIASPVPDQGPRPTCVPCTIAAAHEAERDTFHAAIEPIWWQLHQWGLASEDGTTLDAAGRALPHSGHCGADLWPYDETLGFGTEPPPPNAGTPPWTCANLVDIELAHDGVEDEIEDQLAAGHPVAVVLEISDGFQDPDPDAYIATPDITAPADGYHAVLIVGAWTDSLHGRVFLIRNSWGEFWGAGGYGLLAVEYLVAFGVQAAKVVV